LIVPSSRRFGAGTLTVAALALATLAGCGGFVPGASSNRPSLGAAGSVRDIGRTNARRAARIVVQLRYNHEAELERLVDRLERTRAPQYLTRRAFLARYAPTVQQEAAVVKALAALGFRITKRYPNRLIVDAIAPAATIERAFSTEMHDFREARYGVRSANVRGLRIPKALAAYVAAVDADGRVLARRAGERARLVPEAAIPNVVKNGNFDTGKLTPWKNCGTSAVSLANKHPKNGHFDAFLGSTSGEPKGWSAICQHVVIPTRGVLSAWLYQLADEPNEKHAFAEIALADSAGKPKVVLSRSSANVGLWTHHTWNVAQYAGREETLFFGVHGAGRKAHYEAQYVDDVTLTGVAPSPTPLPGLDPNGSWGPSNVANGVSMPSTLGRTGSGQTAAIVIDATVASSDVAAYLTYFKIPFTGTATEEAVDGGGAPDFQGEATLDTETIAGLAPASNIIIYNVPQLDSLSIEDAYNQIVSDGLATVANSSFGQCEPNDPTFPTLTDAIAMGAAAQGVTFSASSGDAGEGCPDANGGYSAGVNSPASGPHFVSVGGTQSGSGAGPTTPITNPAVWNDTVGAGGGGVSTVWSPPPYQQTIPGASASGRNVPDIALPAVNGSLYFEGAWYQLWGTSWSSPIYVSMQMEINQACAKQQWGLSELYGAFAKTGYQFDFIDVISGNNSWDGGTGYSATAAFDNVSGIGIPLGNQLVTDTCGAR
jgi:hypothetical protein